MPGDNRDNLGSINQRISTLEKTKAGSEYVVSEFKHIREGLEDVKVKAEREHVCESIRLIESLQSQLRDNEQSIKKLYTWQATVGISLLVFFLTIGVAALRFVDNIDYAVKNNVTRLDEIEDSVSSNNNEISKSDLLDFKNEIMLLIKYGKDHK